MVKKVSNEEIMTYIVQNFDRLDKKIDKVEESMVTRMDGVYNLVDQAVNELKDMREEQAAHAQRHDDIDQRLNIIEATPAVALELKKKSH